MTADPRGTIREEKAAAGFIRPSNGPHVQNTWKHYDNAANGIHGSFFTSPEII